MKLFVNSTQKRDGVYVITLAGRLDTNTYPDLESRVDGVLQEKPHTLIFDMGELNYISSMGIRVIAKAQKVMKDYYGKALLFNMQPQIQKVFDIVKALPSQQIFSTMNELDDYLDRMQRSVTDPEDISI
ncbi:STAS domain-containing protein [Desulfosarcina sp. OttesenSCG-928-G10]|nr:STAS domain-containing protein [Desulfosarcina sp. OttesenSCG-928-G10]